MKDFFVFRSNQPLEESLNSAVDFYLTDDTKLPRLVYATYQLDGVDYGMSLEETNFPKVYEFAHCIHR